MFAADLSWTEPGAEKVGERRDRKARERSVAAESGQSTRSSRSSVSIDRELWWTAGLKKAKSITPSIRRPSVIRGSTSQRGARVAPKDLDITLAQGFKDPILQPHWTYSGKLSTTLPSGAPLDPLEHEVPELDGDASSQRTDSMQSRQSHDHRWEPKTPVSIDGIKQKTSPNSFKTSRTRASSVATQREPPVYVAIPECERKKQNRPQTVIIEGTLTMEALRDAIEEVPSPKTVTHTSVQEINPEPKFACRPLSQWDCLAPREVPTEMRPLPSPVVSNVAVAHSKPLEPRFQRFIRRMESAGPEIVLDRLKEDWLEPAGDEADDESNLDKQLWLLTGFQMQNMGNVRIAPRPDCNTGRILELYGNLSEVYQSSVMYPSQTVHFLTTKPQRSLPLPSNVSYLTVRDVGAVPLPYPEEYFSHVRASTLPSLVPSSKLPELFGECYKLLASGGLLEIRVMDAAPLRKTSGPLMKMWIEDMLSVNLEKLFRCSKPCMLVPGWLKDAGFELFDDGNSQNIALPCAYDASSQDVSKELSTVIGQSLWKDMWGSFVESIPGEPQWWWEDKDIVEECLRRKTVLECRTIFAYKK